MERKYFQPIAGQKYLNSNGSTYFCLIEGNKIRSSLICSALLISIKSGWVLLAHECQQNEDGTIVWNRSEGRGFFDVQTTVEGYGFDGRLVSSLSDK